MNRYNFLECRPDCYSQWYAQASRLREQGLWQDALFCYDKALSYYNDDYKVWYGRGKVLEQLNLITEAVTNLQKACQIKPLNYWAWYDLGCILQEYDHDYQRSLECFQQALLSNPEDYWATYRCAQSYYFLKKYLPALDLLQKALQLRPNDYWSYYWQGKCRQAIGQCFCTQNSYLCALQIKPDDYWTLKQLGLLMEKHCFYLDAIAYYETIVSSEQANHEIYQHLQTCYSIIDNQPKAEEYQQKINLLNSKLDKEN